MSRPALARHPAEMQRRFPLAFALVAIAASLAHAQTDGAFSRAERARLLAGELVRRDTTRTEGRHQLFGGTSWIRVRAPIDVVWRTVRDPRSYPRLIPSLQRVQIVEREDDSVLLRMHHEYAISATDYHARMSFDDGARTVHFELDRSRPSEIQAGRGFLTLTAYRGDTIVAWGMLADLGAGPLQQVFGPMLNDWLLKPPRCLRDEVEPGRINEC